MQTKKHNTSPMWIWIVVVVLIAAAVIYFLTRNNSTNDNNAVTHGSTSFIPAPQAVVNGTTALYTVA